MPAMRSVDVLGELGGRVKITYDDEQKSDNMYCSPADQGSYTEAGICITYNGKESIAAVTNFFRRTGLRGQGHMEGVQALTAEICLFYFMHPWSSMVIHGHPLRI